METAQIIELKNVISLFLDASAIPKPFVVRGVSSEVFIIERAQRIALYICLQIIKVRNLK